MGGKNLVRRLVVQARLWPEFFLILIIVLIVAGHQLAPYGPGTQNLGEALAQPDAHHLLGTDELGRDILSRLMAGASSTLFGPIFMALFATSIATISGLYAGYQGGWLDATLSRLAEFIYTFPALLVAVVVIGTLGGGYVSAVFLLGVLVTPYPFRVIRAATMQQRSLAYVEAAVGSGMRTRQILARHIWPNVSRITFANLLLTFAWAIAAMSGLSFLGLGAPVGSANWGRMLSDQQDFIFSNPLGALAPAAMIGITAVASALVADRVGSRRLTRRQRRRASVS